MPHSNVVILVAALSIPFLLFLILRLKLSEVLSLFITSVVVGLAVGMSPVDLWEAIRYGMADTLGFLAVVISIGTMFGGILQITGGAQCLATTLFQQFGEKKVIWALGFVGMLVAVPIFMEVAIVIFAPIIYSLAKNSKKPLTYFALPLLAGIVIAYSTIPPAAGALAGVGALKSEVGLVIVFSVIAAIPAVLIAGPIYGGYISKHIPGHIPEAMDFVEEPLVECGSDLSSESGSSRKTPSFGKVVLLFACPLFLMVGRSVANLTLPEDHSVRSFMELVGHPFGALLIVCLLAIYFFGIRNGFSKEELQAVTSKSLEPAGMILIITGAGGVFGEVLVRTGIGDIIADFSDKIGMPLLVLAFATSLFIRVAQGSGTVAIITAATLMHPLAVNAGLSVPMTALMSSVIGFGAITCSHLNDSAYWIVKRYFGLTEVETLKTWTAMVTIIGFVGFGVCLIISMFL